MAKRTITLKESELIKLIEDIATEHQQQSRLKLVEGSREYKHITKRFGRIMEKYRTKGPNILTMAILMEKNRLVKKGYDEDIVIESLSSHSKILNEGILDGVWGSIREGMYNWLLGIIGIPVGEFRDALKIALGNVPFMEIPKLLKCNYLVDVLASATEEYMIKKAIGAFAGAEGNMQMTIRNVIADYMQDSRVHTVLVEKLESLVCGKLFGKKSQVEDVLNSKSAEASADNITRNKDDKGDIFSGMLSSLWDSISGAFSSKASTA